MPKRIHLESHLEAGGVRSRYREACDAVERSQHQIVRVWAR